MPHRKVKDAIDELNAELQQTPKETGRFESFLETAKESIERLTPEAAQDLLDALEREAKEFEVEHPRVTEAINRVANSLSAMGI